MVIEADIRLGDGRTVHGCGSDPLDRRAICSAAAVQPSGFVPDDIRAGLHIVPIATQV